MSQRRPSFAILAFWILLSSMGSLVRSSRADDAVPADPAPRWMKGNLHTHSLWSDGNDFPEMIAEWYRTHDYQFLALSDHNVLSEGVRFMPWAQIEKRGYKEALNKYRERFGDAWVETRGDAAAGTLAVRLKPLDEFRHLVEERGKFLMIQSEELSDQVGRKPLHINVANVKELIRPLGGTTIQEAMSADLRAIEEQEQRTGRPMIVHLNHPNFGWAITAEDIAAVVNERFFEVYNGHTGVNNDGDELRAGMEEIWDIANTLRLTSLNAAPLMGLATDDSHHYDGAQDQRPGRGWIMVRAKHLTPESLMLAIKAGDFYSSTGVTLRDVRFDANTKQLTIEIEPDGDAEYTTRFIGTPRNVSTEGTARVDAKGEPLDTTKKYSQEIGRTYATVPGLNPSYTLDGTELYIRAVVTSSKPHPDPSLKGQLQQAWTQPTGWTISPSEGAE
jgi:hypothetical protein